VRAFLLGLVAASAACGARSDLFVDESGPPIDPPEGECGNGVVELGEACDAGEANGERVPALALEVDGEELVVAPIVTSEDAVSFYDYTSVSAHTGFEAPFTSLAFAHVARLSSELSIFSIHNIDRDSSGVATGQGFARQRYSGLPPGAFVALSDEQHELFLAGASEAEGDWQWQDNTDGGVIGGLPLPGDWRVDFEITSSSTTAYSFIDAGGPIDLPFRQSAPLIARSAGPSCTRTCESIRCGDGVVDAGEVCDDGNTTDGDGCRGDCLVFD